MTGTPGRFEVVVVGASMAGLHSASQLARGRKKVAVFERQRTLNPARRTLIVTPELKKILPDIPTTSLLHATGTMRLASPAASTTIRLIPDLIIERASVMRWMLKEAEAAGVEVFLGHRFERFIPTGDKVRTCFRDPSGKPLEVEAETVIGADGVNSMVTQAANLPAPSSVPIVQAEVKLPHGWDPDVTQVWFDGATRFFYWLIPESEQRGVAGLVGESGPQARRLLAKFLQRHELVAEKYQGAKVALHHPRFKPWGKLGNLRIMLVGDSAAQVKVTTVGGTVTGIQGARAAARSILNGTRYRTELRSLNRELNLHWLIRLMLERLDDEGYDLLLESIGAPAKDFLEAHNRDSMAPVLWRLPFVEPRLWKVGLRCLRGASEKRVPRPAPIEQPVPEVES